MQLINLKTAIQIMDTLSFILHLQIQEEVWQFQPKEMKIPTTLKI